MLYREGGEGCIAISQPMHAWISGQLLRALPGPLGEPLYLGAEQHDIAWLDWEVAPTFDGATGRPHLFRNIGAQLHAPMWLAGVERALAAYGPHVALLVSRHGGTIYRRFSTRHRLDARDAVAAQGYLDHQAPREAQWAQMLGLADAELQYQSSLIAFVDNLSLALCGDLKPPLEIAFPVRGEGDRMLALRDKSGAAYEFTLSDWPFAKPSVVVEGEGRRLARTYASEAAFQACWAAAPRAPISARLSAA